MADQAERRGVVWAGRPVRRAASFGRGATSRRLRLVGIPIEPDLPQQVLEGLPPDVEPRLVRTRAAFAQLTGDGIDADDAVGLIGYAVGLTQGGSRWSLDQINTLLFLRDMYARGHWDEVELGPR